MLEGLFDVPWAELEHAYGPASDVPDLIVALRSPTPEVRKKALWELYGNIFHQGTRYEASAYAAPFLLELLADPATPERRGVLELLTSLAVGYDETWLPEGFPVASYRQRAVGGEELLRARPPLTADEDDESGYRDWESLDEEQQEQMYAHVELAVYDAVRTGVPLFRTLLAHDDPALRVAAAYALGWFAEDAAGSVPPLTAPVADQEAAVAATALVALGLVGTDDPAALRTAKAALDDRRDVVRWGAAIALARLQGPAAGPRVAAEPLGGRRQRQPCRHPVPRWRPGRVRRPGHASTRRHTGRSGVRGVARQDSTVCGPEALPIVGEALRRAFPGGVVAAGTPFDTLDHRQQRLLRALADSPRTWGWGEYRTFGNFTLMVAAFGLPSDVIAMRSYVS